MIRCIVVEDDPGHSERLVRLINESGEAVSVLAICRNVNDSLEAIGKHDPELIFLDVDLERGETGFDLLQRVQVIKFSVIFTTAHQDNKLRAIQMSALDFLHKPVDSVDLLYALERFKLARLSRSESERLKNLQSNLSTPPGIRQHIMIVEGSGYLKVQVSNIVYCFSERGALDFFLAEPVSGKVKITSTREIGHWEAILSPSGIYRIHNSYLVNPQYISRYNRGEGGTVLMSNGKELPVSRSRKTRLLELLGID